MVSSIASWWLLCEMPYSEHNVDNEERPKNPADSANLHEHKNIKFGMLLMLYLHNILTIVVGLEFVRMLIDMTPANTLEVLIVAIARQVILTHNDPLSNLASVICIAGLFATRRFLVAKKALKIELSEVE